jgi:hypothetical protein|uniref:Link domain-containing protein n=1 Tax=viral metagenome TaxID=1070528 RepID=A0A6C0C0P6_9ZZZZ
MNNIPQPPPNNTQPPDFNSDGGGGLNISPSDGYPKMYDFIDNGINAGSNPSVLIMFTFIIVIYYVIFHYLGISLAQEAQMSPEQLNTPGITFLEIVMWGLFIFLVLINGMQYFFKIDVKTGIKNLFSPTPEVDLTISMPEDEEEEEVIEEEPLPEIKYDKQVFHVPNNIYTYKDAKAVCKAFGAELADYDQIEKAYKNGAEWCGFGWSKNQMALYPTQKNSWKKLQKRKGRENDCGRPGINGGFIDNKQAPFGVNCYGYKPKMSQEEELTMKKHKLVPANKADKRFEKLVKKYRDQIKDIAVSPFNYGEWSKL